MRLRRGRWLLLLALVGCTTTAPPPVPRPPVAVNSGPTEFDRALAAYESPADAPTVAAALDRLLAEGQRVPADLSTVELTNYANVLLTAQRLSDAEHAFAVLASRPGPDRSVLYALALLAGARGDAAAQTERVAAFAQAYPGDPVALALQARLLTTRGDLAGARAAWLKVVAAREDADALIALARLDGTAKRPADALSWSQRAVNAAPENDQAWAGHAQALSDLGRYGEARAALDRAVALAPEDAWHRLDRGKLLWRHLFDAAGARADLEFVTAKAPQVFFGWAALAEVYEEQGQAHAAYDAWQRALSLEPDYRFAYPSAAMLAFRFQDFARAAAWAREAAKDYPGEYGFVFVEALSLRALGQADASMAVLVRARPRFERGSTVDALFRFLITPGSDYYLNGALNLEKKESIRLRLRFYQGCAYALAKAPASAKAAFDEVGASTLQKIPEIGAARDWLDHGL